MSQQRTLSNDPRCVYTSRAGLFAVLRQYGVWYAQGMSDRQISAAIAVTYKKAAPPAGPLKPWGARR